MKKNPPKYVSVDEALEKLKHYCAYQERCHQEVRSKLLSLKIYGDDLENIIIQLIDENYLNEERYARSYARGKFRIKSWGKTKILHGLKLRDISDYCQRKAMEEIEEGEYRETLEKLLESRKSRLSTEDIYLQRKDLTAFGVRKGYEYALVKETVENMLTYK